MYQRADPYAVGGNDEDDDGEEENYDGDEYGGDDDRSDEVDMFTQDW